MAAGEELRRLPRSRQRLLADQDGRGGLTRGAAFGAASCCGLPFLLGAAGIGTAWLTGFALLATPHRAAQLIVGIVGLTGGAILLWRQQRTAACTPVAFCVLRVACRQDSHTRRPAGWTGAALSRVRLRMTNQVILQSTITCPSCDTSKTETMPSNACQFFYDCTGCGMLLRPKPGDCCVFCSFGTVPCPPIQEARGKDACCASAQ